MIFILILAAYLHLASGAICEPWQTGAVRIAAPPGSTLSVVCPGAAVVTDPGEAR